LISASPHTGFWAETVVFSHGHLVEGNDLVYAVDDFKKLRPRNQSADADAIRHAADVRVEHLRGPKPSYDLEGIRISQIVRRKGYPYAEKTALDDFAGAVSNQSLAAKRRK